MDRLKVSKDTKYNQNKEDDNKKATLKTKNEIEI